MMMCGALDEFAKELRFLSRLSHSHVVPFYGICIQHAPNQTKSQSSDEQPPRFFLVTKFAVRRHSLHSFVACRMKSPCGS